MEHLIDEDIGLNVELGGVAFEEGELLDAFVVGGDDGEPGRRVEDGNADQDQKDH